MQSSIPVYNGGMQIKVGGKACKPGAGMVAEGKGEESKCLDCG
jgi:hypothetical protein